jgi:hypothetical protein
VSANDATPQAKSRPKMPRKAGDIARLRRAMWWSVRHCEHLLATADSDEKILRTVHALTQASLAYAKLVEVSELSEKVRHLEAMLAPRNGHHG